MTRIPSAVHVVWRDAFDAGDTWVDPSEPPESPVLVETVGFVMPSYLDGYLVLASSRIERDGELTYGGVQYIPAGMVVSLTYREDT